MSKTGHVKRQTRLRWMFLVGGLCSLITTQRSSAQTPDPNVRLSRARESVQNMLTGLNDRWFAFTLTQTRVSPRNESSRDVAVGLICYQGDALYACYRLDRFKDDRQYVATQSVEALINDQLALLSSHKDGEQHTVSYGIDDRQRRIVAASAQQYCDVTQRYQRAITTHLTNEFAVARTDDRGQFRVEYSHAMIQRTTNPTAEGELVFSVSFAPEKNLPIRSTVTLQNSEGDDILRGETQIAYTGRTGVYPARILTETFSDDASRRTLQQEFRLIETPAPPWITSPPQVAAVKGRVTFRDGSDVRETLSELPSVVQEHVAFVDAEEFDVLAAERSALIQTLITHPPPRVPFGDADAATETQPAPSRSQWFTVIIGLFAAGSLLLIAIWIRIWRSLQIKR